MFKDLIKIKKISLYALSKKSGVSYTAVNELYRGERTIEECSVKTAKALADSFNMDLDSFYNESIKKPAIPQSFKKYFWDTEFSKLNLEKNRTYIISRLLNAGTIEAFNFLMAAYTYEDFKFVAEKSRLLTPKVAHFLINNYKVKRENMTFFKQKIDWRQPDAFRNN